MGLSLRQSLVWLTALGGVALRTSARPNITSDYALYASPDGHYFQTGDGKPFFWQADTAWNLFGSLTFDETRQYLEDRASKGFNIALAVAINDRTMQPGQETGEVPFVNKDPTQPNEAYWAYVDRVIELAWSYGIRICMVPSWGSFTHGNENQVGMFGTVETAGPFGKFIGERYPYLPMTLVGDTNPWWISKSGLKNAYAAGGVIPDFEPVDWRPVYHAMAHGIVEEQRSVVPNTLRRYKPLISSHSQNQWFTGGPLALASSYFGDDHEYGWLTFDTSQSGHTDYPPNPPIPWWNCRRGWEPAQLMYAVGETIKGRKRPALDNEPHYEWRFNNAKGPVYWNASDVRIGSWQTAFTGMAGITYGADMVMRFYRPEEDTPTHGVAITWDEAVKLPGAAQMQHIKKAIFDRGNGSYFRRIPAQSIIVGDTATNDKRIFATRDSKGSWIMVYTPVGAQFTIDVSSLVGNRVRASWFDPTTGEYTPFEFTRGSQQATFTPPIVETHPDWTLVLEAA